MTDSERYAALTQRLLAGYCKQYDVPETVLQARLAESGFACAKLPRGRVCCTDVLSACLPMMERIAETPAQGWMSAVYELLCTELFPTPQAEAVSAERRMAMEFYLTVLEYLLDTEDCPFDPLSDIAKVTQEERANSLIGEQYQRFEALARASRYRELLRIGREIMPFDPASHTVGVHHVALHIGRQAVRQGIAVDIPMVSAASLSHDVGKFGCRGEDAKRIPYLHYYYTYDWLMRGGLPDIAHVAANHSTWDLEFENLPIESLLLIYADFRVRGERGADGREHIRIFTLGEAYEAIYRKLADMTPQKQRRYKLVYFKLRDFERYLMDLGVNPDPLSDAPLPVQNTEPALLDAGGAVRRLCDMTFENNIRLMRTATASDSFDALLEQARNEKNLQRIRIYLRLFEEYSAYMTRTHKLLTLRLLYELLMHHEGDVRRDAGRIMGAILANSGLNDRKQLPAGAADGAMAPAMQAVLEESAELFDRYMEQCLHPDHKISPKHALRIENSLKTIVKSLFAHCPPSERRQYFLPLYRRICSAAQEELFVLTDTLLHVPASLLTPEESRRLTAILAEAASGGEPRLRIQALRCLLTVCAGDPALLGLAASSIRCEADAPFAVAFLCGRLQTAAGRDAVPLQKRAVASVYLENLKSSVSWTVKLANIEWLKAYARANRRDAFHVAMHFSNLLSVSEHLPVRESAGEALLAVADLLRTDQQNEIAVDLLRELETGQNEISSYIPPYLGRLIGLMPEKETDEAIDYLAGLIRISNPRAARAALSTLAAVLCGTTDSSRRAREVSERTTGLLLTGVAHFDESIHIEALEALMRGYFAQDDCPMQARRETLLRCGKKLAALLSERREGTLAFFSRCAMLNHLYRFLKACEADSGFSFAKPRKAAFFPGTFDPFSTGHKQIVEEILKEGFEVYLAIDEFSWSKRTLPKLLRRRIAGMSTAGLPDVYLFPDDIPVNIAVAEDLAALRARFDGRELYLVAGSDVILNASAYQDASKGAARYYNHILFSRVDGQRPAPGRSAREILCGKVIELRLPAYYEAASSTQIRNYIDRDLDIAMLVDPVAQDFIYAGGLYLRAPQDKREARQKTSFRLDLERRENAYTVRCTREPDGAKLGFVTGYSISVMELYGSLGNTRAAEAVRDCVSGRILLLRAMRGEGEALRVMLCDILTRSLSGGHTYALCTDAGSAAELLGEMGFVPVPGQADMLYTDMRKPAVLIQDALQRIKEPFASDGAVEEAVQRTRPALRSAISAMIPGQLLLSYDAELLNAGLAEKVRRFNGVSDISPGIRRLGKRMCVPYGQIFADTMVPNTVTKALHADKVFHSDIIGFDITESPGYSPLMTQVKTIKSFRLPVLLVDDVLHNGYRLAKLDPLFRAQQVEVDRVLVGVLSGRGRDIMRREGRRVECEYFIPNLAYWFTESLLYPFFGGDNVEGGAQLLSFARSINLVLPYQYPAYLHGVQKEAVWRFSMEALNNALAILTALEENYQKRYFNVLTLKRLGEVMSRPRFPDKGAHLGYEDAVLASAYLRDDISLLRRIGGGREEQ